MYKKRCVSTLTMLALSVTLISSQAGASGLMGWWKFDDGSGTVAEDSSGNGYDGTVYDAVWVDGQLGGALNFAGAEYVDLPAEACETIDTQLTVTFWTFIEFTGSQWPFTFAAYTVPSNNEARVFSAHLPWADGNLYFDTGGTDAGGYDRIVNALEQDEWANIWAHWAFVKNVETGEQQIFRNGVLWHGESGKTMVMKGADVTKFTVGCKPSLSAENFFTGTIDDFRLYNRALTADELADVMLGKGPNAELAGAPIPADEASDVLRDITLSWESGEFATTHDVYLGTALDDVNEASRDNPLNVLVSEGQSDTTYTPLAVLEYGQTYYWRVDEVNAAPDNTVFNGTVWSFTVEPVAYPIENVTATSNGTSDPGVGPENTINGSGLSGADEHSTVSDDMWLAWPADEPLYIQYQFDDVYKLHEMLVWNYNIQFELLLGFGIQNVTIEYSENGADWMSLGDVQLNQATAENTYTPNTTVDFAGVLAQYVRLTVNSGYGMMGQYGLSEVRFMYIPANAREPQPVDGAANVSPDAVLSWRAGRGAVTHEVYLSTDEAAVTDSTALADVVSDSHYAPTDLELDNTYHWKVVEVNEAEAISAWEGNVWRFTTQEFLVVDDFESYNDDDNRIYETWDDGFVNGTGSTVGYLEAPFAEQQIVQGGDQSMPLFYDGDSEADLALPGQDWTRAGITTLTVYFRGDAENDPGWLYAMINGNRVDFSDDASAIAQLRWQTWNIDLASVGGNLSNVSNLTLGVESSGSGLIFVDNIRLYREAPPVATPVNPGNEGLLLEYTFEGNTSDSSGNGYDGILLGDAAVQNGVLTLDGTRDAMSVPRIGGDDAVFDAATISMWVRPAEDLSSLQFAGGMNTDGWAAGAVHFKFSYGLLNIGINGISDLQGNTPVEANVWHHIAATISPTEVAIYLNGGQEDRVALDAPLEVILGGASIGAWNNGGTLEREMAGEVDNVCIYDRALSAGEVLFLADI